MRLANILFIFLVYICSCAETNRTVVVTNLFISDLPDSALGDYIIESVTFENIESGDKERYTRYNRQYYGLLTIDESYLKFYYKRSHTKVKNEVEGFYEIRHDVLILYASEARQHIVDVYQYMAAVSRFTLEWYEPSINFRTVLRWKKLPLLDSDGS